MVPGDWLLSLSTEVSKFIHAAARIRVVFLLTDEEDSNVSLYGSLSTFLTDGHLCAYFLAIVNGTAMNIRASVLCGHVFLSLGYNV